MTTTRTTKQRRSALRTLPYVLVAGLALGVVQLTGLTGRPTSAEPAPADASSADDTKGAVERCMRERGHEISLDATDPMVLSDLARAQTYGYGISIPMGVATPGPTVSVSDEAGQDLSACAAAGRAESPNGKLQQAYGRLAAGLEAERRTVKGSLDSVIATLPGADAALASWRDCMAEAGQGGYRSPGEARAEIQRLYDVQPESKAPIRIPTAGEPLEGSAALTELRARERQLATADVSCRERELIPALVSVIDGYLASS